MEYIWDIMRIKKMVTLQLDKSGDLLHLDHLEYLWVMKHIELHTSEGTAGPEIMRSSLEVMAM